MEESSDYEKRIKDKREQNKNKLKELGLTPILDNIASAAPKASKPKKSPVLKKHKKFTNPTSPSRISSRLNKSKSDLSPNSQDGTKRTSYKEPQEVIIFDATTSICPPEQSVIYYHKKLVRAFQPLCDMFQNNAITAMIEAQYAAMRERSKHIQESLSAEQGAPDNRNKAGKHTAHEDKHVDDDVPMRESSEESDGDNRHTANMDKAMRDVGESGDEEDHRDEDNGEDNNSNEDNNSDEGGHNNEDNNSHESSHNDEDNDEDNNNGEEESAENNDSEDENSNEVNNHNKAASNHSDSERSDDSARSGPRVVKKRRVQQKSSRGSDASSQRSDDSHDEDSNYSQHSAENKHSSVSSEDESSSSSDSEDEASNESDSSDHNNSGGDSNNNDSDNSSNSNSKSSDSDE